MPIQHSAVAVDMDHARSVVGDNIQTSREAAGIARKDLAHMLGVVHGTYLGRLESGHVEFSLCRLIEISDCIGVKPSELSHGV